MKQSETDYTQTAEVELLACPFCGGRARYLQHRTRLLFWAHCTHCGANSTQREPSHINEDGINRVLRRVARDWNSRA